MDLVKALEYLVTKIQNNVYNISDKSKPIAPITKTVEDAIYEKNKFTCIKLSNNKLITGIQRILIQRANIPSNPANKVPGIL